jgi:hypothetical protein
MIIFVSIYYSSARYDESVLPRHDALRLIANCEQPLTGNYSRLVFEFIVFGVLLYRIMIDFVSLNCRVSCNYMHMGKFLGTIISKFTDYLKMKYFQTIFQCSSFLVNIIETN